MKQTKSHISGAAHDQTLNRVDRTPDPQRVARSARAGFLHETDRLARTQHLGRRASPQYLGRAGGVNKRQNLSRGRHGIMTAPSVRPRDRRSAKCHRRPERVRLRNVLCGSGRVLGIRCSNDRDAGSVRSRSGRHWLPQSSLPCAPVATDLCGCIHSASIGTGAVSCTRERIERDGFVSREATVRSPEGGAHWLHRSTRQHT